MKPEGHSLALAPALLIAVLLAVPALASGDYRFEKRLDLAAEGTFSLHTEVGDVLVRGGEGGRAAVTMTSDRDDLAEHFVVRFDAPRPDRVELVVERKSSSPAGWFQSFRSHTRIEVALPATAAAELAASGGRVEVSNLAGAVRAESSGGSLQASDLGGDRVRIREARGAVVARSSGGAVSVGFAAGNAKGGRLDSSGGGVTATLDPSVALEIDASASGSHVDRGLPVTVQGKLSRDTLRGRLNGGGALLHLRSSGGDVTIASR